MLRWLYQAKENRLTMTELGASLEASMPNVIRMVQSLETQDWVRRVPSEQDRRVMYVELTKEGHERLSNFFRRPSMSGKSCSRVVCRPKSKRSLATC